MALSVKTKKMLRRGPFRKVPAPVDYNDEISAEMLEAIRVAASSKDKVGQQWVTVHEPAW
jgi:hypothetical protein